MAWTGIVKALTGSDRADTVTIYRRRAICRDCAELNRLGQCRACKCLVVLKSTVASETCPYRRW